VDNSSDHHRSCDRLFVPDRGGVAPERQEWRPGGGLRRPGQPDRIWPARRSHGAHQGDHVVGDYLHGHVDHAVDLRCTPDGTGFCAFRREGGNHQVPAGSAAKATAGAGTVAEVALSGSSRHSAVSGVRTVFLGRDPLLVDLQG